MRSCKDLRFLRGEKSRVSIRPDLRLRKKVRARLRTRVLICLTPLASLVRK